ncbi:MAG TPA: CBS domain-containing protein [Pirellulaceae bacterium]
MTFHLHLDSETLGRIRTSAVFDVAPHETLREVLQGMRTGRRASVLVCQDGRLLGIFTERDAVRLMADPQNLDKPIESLMTANPRTVNATETVGRAIELMSRGGYRRLPILDAEGKPSAMVKVSHVLHYLVQHFPKIIYNLPPKPHLKTQEREGA